MCKDKLKAAMGSAAEAAAPTREGKAARARSGRPGVAAGRQKPSAWTGVRFRHSGRWATEIRVPRTREKVWVGTYATARQAALAYDAAVFCFFGERTPKSRPVNFPAAPHPEISEAARRELSVADMKAVAEKHALHVDALLPPLPAADVDTTTIVAPPPEDLVVAMPATAVAVDAAPYPCACAARRAPLRASSSAAPGLDEDDDLDWLISSIDVEAFQAELDALTFLVSDDEVY